MNRKRFDSLLLQLTSEYDDLVDEFNQLEEDYRAAEQRADMLEAEVECFRAEHSACKEASP